MDRIDKIYDIIKRGMENHGIEDTPENRLRFLRDLRDNLIHSPDLTPEGALWLVAINRELDRLTLPPTFHRPKI